MTIYEAMHNRHSVRSYTDARIDSAVLAALVAEINRCNAESGLNIQLIVESRKRSTVLWRGAGNLQA